MTTILMCRWFLDMTTIPMFFVLPAREGLARAEWAAGGRLEPVRKGPSLEVAHGYPTRPCRDRPGYESSPGERATFEDA